MKEKFWGWVVAILALWAFVKFGWLDMILGGIVGDLTAEAARLTVPLSGLLITLAVPIGIVGLGLLWHRKHRALGIELLVVGAIVVLGAHMLPTAGAWMDREGSVMSANLAHSTTVRPGP